MRCDVPLLYLLVVLLQRVPEVTALLAAVHRDTPSQPRSADVLRAALQWQQQQAKQQADKAAYPMGRLSEKLCSRLSAEINAMECSMVNSLGSLNGNNGPEGCECQLRAASCPQPVPGFTGVSPSNTYSVGEESVILCMFWQWGDTGIEQQRAADAVANKEQSVANAQRYVQAAMNYASTDAKALADHLWEATPTPFPRTPPPELS